MKCYCCDREVTLVRHVKIRGNPFDAPATITSFNDPAFLEYRESATFRSAFVCEECYRVLDSRFGLAQIKGRVYDIAGQSRGGRPAVYNQAKYDAFIRKKARGLGIDPG